MSSISVAATTAGPEATCPVVSEQPSVDPGVTKSGDSNSLEMLPVTGAGTSVNSLCVIAGAAVGPNSGTNSANNELISSYNWQKSSGVCRVKFPLPVPVKVLLPVPGILPV